MNDQVAPLAELTSEEWLKLCQLLRAGSVVSDRALVDSIVHKLDGLVRIEETAESGRFELLHAEPRIVRPEAGGLMCDLRDGRRVRVGRRWLELARYPNLARARAAIVAALVRRGGAVGRTAQLALEAGVSAERISKEIAIIRWRLGPDRDRIVTQGKSGYRVEVPRSDLVPDSFTIDCENVRAWFGDRELSMGPGELAVFAAIAAGGGRIVGPSEIFQAAWHREPRSYDEMTGVRSAVRRIRDQALGPDLTHLLASVRGQGYRLLAPARVIGRIPGRDQRPKALPRLVEFSAAPSGGDMQQRAIVALGGLDSAQWITFLELIANYREWIQPTRLRRRLLAVPGWQDDQFDATLGRVAAALRGFGRVVRGPAGAVALIAADGAIRAPTASDVTVDIRNRVVVIEDRATRLSPVEMAVIAALVRRAGAVAPNAALAVEAGTTRAGLTQRLYTLRRALGPDAGRVMTHAGTGVWLSVNVEVRHWAIGIPGVALHVAERIAAGAGEVVTDTDLMRDVWGEARVTDRGRHRLRIAVTQIGLACPGVIEPVPGGGYRFCGPRSRAVAEPQS